MKARVGQIVQPGPELIANLLQPAVVPTPIGTMAPVLAGLPVVIAATLTLQVPILPAAHILPAGIPPAAVVPNEVATAGNHLTGQLVPAGPAVIRIQAVHHPQEVALVRPDLTG